MNKSKTFLITSIFPLLGASSIFVTNLPQKIGYLATSVCALPAFALGVTILNYILFLKKKPEK